MDLLAIRPSTIDVEIRHPATGQPIGLSVAVVSLSDDRVRAVERQIKNKALRSGRNTMNAEKLEDNTIAILVAAIVSWRWYEIDGTDRAKLGDDENPAFAEASVRKLVAINWIAKQIDDALGDESSFFQK